MSEDHEAGVRSTVRDMEASVSSPPARDEASGTARDQSRDLGLSGQTVLLQTTMQHPGPLRMEGDMARNWRTWRQMWDSYAIVSRLSEYPYDYQLAHFVMSLGEDGLDAYNSLTFAEGEEHTLSKVLSKLETHFTGALNVTYERFVFRSRYQAVDESFDKYLVALRALIKTCGFGVLADDMLKDQIVYGVREEAMRRSLLQKRDLKLTNCIDLCKAAEQSAVQTRQMKEQEGVFAVKRQESKPQQKSTAGTVQNCGYCGRSHAKRRCPAYGTTCKECGRKNHFASVCRRKKTSTVNRTKLTDEEEDTEEEYLLTVTLSEEVNAIQGTELPKSVFATMTVEGQPVDFQLDLGATCNVIRLRDLPPGINIQATTQVLSLYDKSQMQSLGKCLVSMTNPKNGHRYKAQFIVVKDAAVSLLGARTIMQMKLIEIRPENIMMSTSTAEKHDQTPGPLRNGSVPGVISKYDDVFDGGLGRLEGLLHLEVDESVRPVKLPVRKVPLAIRNDLERELKRLQSIGVIEMVDYPTDWVSSLVVVKKTNGSLRVCLDPKHLNQALKRSHYVMPTIDDVLPELAQARVYTVCDLKNGFWHVELDKPSSELTTFGTPFGRYRWKRMPFGITPAPEIFQSRLDQAIANLPGVYTVADDLLVIGEGPTKEAAIQNHDKNLQGLLQRCREKGIKLNKEKLRLRLPAVPYMGHLLTDEGLKADPAKIAAISQMDRPKDVMGVQRLIGTVNYLTRFLPNLADTLQPFRQLTRKGIEFCWTADHDEAFRRLKEALTNTPVLRYFDPQLETTVQCDASQSGLGAALMQRGQPVAYASRALTATEQNYAQIEKELLSVVFGMTKFHHYVYGRHTYAESDHKPLEVIMKKPIQDTPKRLQRMLLQLQQYHLTITYTRGKDMFLADTLSRAYLPDISNEDPSVAPPDVVSSLQSLFEGELESINMTQHLPVTQARLTEIRTHTNQDECLRKVREVIQQGWPDSKTQLPTDVTPYFAIRDELVVQDGIILRGQRLVIPTTLRASMMTKLHTSHLGINACLRRAREHLYWPGMQGHLRDYIQRCDVCRALDQSQPKEPLIPHSVPERPWAKVAIDLFVFQQQNYMVTVDYMSNFAEVDRLESIDAESVIRKLKAHFARHGIPEMVITDNGPQFSGSAFAAFSRKWEFGHNTSSPVFAQSNGKAENAVKTLKALMKRAVLAKEDPWLALLDFRNTTTQGFPSSPAQRLFNRRTNTLLPTSPKVLQPTVTDSQAQYHTASKLRQKQYYDRGSKELSELQQGDVVRVRPMQKATEWQKGIVERKVGIRSYEVRTEHNTYRRNRRHLRKAHLTGPPTIAATPTTDHVQKPSDRPHLKQPPPAAKSPEQETTQGNLGQKEQQAVVTRAGRIVKPPRYLEDYCQ